MRLLTARACQAGFVLGMCIATFVGARAQEIEPREFLPLPAGTNLEIGYYIHGSNYNYIGTNGTKVPNSNLEVNIGLERYVHYFNVGGMPAGVQVLQTFGAYSDARLGGASLGNAFGAGNTALSAFIWPYSNPTLNQHFNITGFLYPPVGTYDKNSAINLAGSLSGSPGWTGDLEIGWDHAIGDHFSYDLALDLHFYGDTTGPIQPGVPISVRTNRNPDLRAQVWLNWAWNRAFTTAVGYEGSWGGDAYFNNPIQLGGLGHTDTAASKFQRIRAAASMFVSPRLQFLLEGNHDFDRNGGFEQAWGITLRALYVF